MHDTTRFVAACCRWPFDQAAVRAVEAAAAQVSDWDDARDVVMRHRVVALVNGAVQGQNAVPEAFRVWVQGVARAQTVAALRLTQECIAIDATLVAAGITPVHVKGPVLGQLAFGSVARKYSRDLDILVPEDAGVKAIFLLQDQGYRRGGTEAPLTEKQARAVVRHCKDVMLVGPSGNLVELHWRLTHPQALLRGLESRLAPQSVPIAQAANLQTMGDEATVLYLCVHGVTHHWMRLKWLAELSAFLNQLDPTRRAEILKTVAKSPEGNAVASALALCDTFLGTDYAPALSPRAEALYRYALRRIDLPLVRTRRFGGDWRILVDLLEMRHLYPSAWAGVWALKAHLIAQDDVVALPLPASLNMAYVIIRFPSLLLRRLKTLAHERKQRLKSPA